MMDRYSLYFTKPKTVEIKKERLQAPQGEQVLVKTLFSSISAGTEMLFYNAELQEDVMVDDTIESLKHPFKYPLKYGYATVGEIVSLGQNIPQDWLHKTVFAFHPHENYFVAPLNELIEIPETIPLTDATFLPSIETAVSLVMDGAPLIGEEVLIFGQGIIGLLLTSVLSLFPVRRVITVEKLPLRQKKSQELGAYKSISSVQNPSEYFPSQLQADLLYELTGNPDMLQDAIKCVIYTGRIIIGSWYGKKTSQVSLGTDFHRKRIQIVSSQVSKIQPSYSGRWDKKRRIDVCWKLLKTIKPDRLVSHIIPFENAQKAYEMIDAHPDKTLQVLLKY
jgi:2-desacetyl-2-hydroxyethyl bacteriochlorophyllide A dehydrogenase